MDSLSLFPSVLTAPVIRVEEGRGAADAPKVGPEERVEVCRFSGEQAEVP